MHAGMCAHNPRYRCSHALVRFFWGVGPTLALKELVPYFEALPHSADLTVLYESANDAPASDEGATAPPEPVLPDPVAGA